VDNWRNATIGVIVHDCPGQAWCTHCVHNCRRSAATQKTANDFSLSPIRAIRVIRGSIPLLPMTIDSIISKVWGFCTTPGAGAALWFDTGSRCRMIYPCQ